MPNRASGKRAEKDGRDCEGCHRNASSYNVVINAAVTMRARLCIRCTNKMLRAHPQSIATEIPKRD